MNHHVVAQEADITASLDNAFGDITTRDLADLGDVEDFTDFSVADKFFLAIR